MYDLARLGFVLVGLWGILDVLRSIAHSFRVPIGTTEILPFFAIQALVLFLSALLAFRSRRFARYLFSPEEPALPARGLLTAALAVLGAYLFFRGFSGVLAFTYTSLLVHDRFAGMHITTAVWGAFEAGLGVLLYRFPSRIAPLARLIESDRPA